MGSTIVLGGCIGSKKPKCPIYADKCVEQFGTRNDTTISLLVAYSLSYPDTTLKLEDKGGSSGLFPGDEKIFESDNWEETINATARDTMSLYFIPLDSLNTEGWSGIVANQRIIKRIDFGYQFLKDKSWITSYSD